MRGFVFDAGAFIGLERRAPLMLGIFDEALRGRVEVILPRTVIAQVWRGTAPPARRGRVDHARPRARQPGRHRRAHAGAGKADRCDDRPDFASGHRGRSRRAGGRRTRTRRPHVGRRRYCPHRRATRAGACLTGRPNEILLDIGERRRDTGPGRRADSMAIIEARGLARTFKSRKRTVEAVRGVDLTVHDGEIVGFLGPNGAGKTTTLRMLTTLLRPTAGSATVAGADLLANPLDVRKKIGYVAQAIR